VVFVNRQVFAPSPAQEKKIERSFQKAIPSIAENFFRMGILMFQQL
jgi:hypothetical protein